jgi:hypothetical protein
MDLYASLTDTELEARCDDLYQQIMAGFDSLPVATWTEEYQAAIREICGQEIQFRAITVELSRRHAERTRPRGLASCGHPADEDGECSCSSWPERATDA